MVETPSVGRQGNASGSSQGVLSGMDNDGTVTREVNGPGTAWMEFDAALHRAVGIGAVAVITWLTTRPGISARCVGWARTPAVRHTPGSARVRTARSAWTT